MQTMHADMTVHASVPLGRERVHVIMAIFIINALQKAHNHARTRARTHCDRIVFTYSMISYWSI